MENSLAKAVEQPEGDGLVGPADPNTMVSGGLVVMGAVVGAYALVEHAPSELRVGIALGVLAVGAVAAGARSYRNYRRRRQEEAEMPEGFVYRDISLREAFSPMSALSAVAGVASLANLSYVAEKYIYNNTVDLPRIAISALVLSIFVRQTEREQEGMRIPAGSTIHRLSRRPLRGLPRRRGDE